MALIRCAQCQAPLTESEATAATCPMCAQPLPLARAAADEAAGKSSTPPPPPSRMLPWVGGCVLGMLLLAYLLLGDRLKKISETPTQLAAAPVVTAVEKKPAVPASPTPTTRSSEKEQEAPKQSEPEPPPPEPKEPLGVAKLKPPPTAEPKVAPLLQGELRAQAKGEHRGEVVLPFLDLKNIAIDGNLEDWKELTPLVLHAVTRGNSPKPVIKAPPEARAYAAYCTKGLLIAVDVPDTSGALENVGRGSTRGWAFWDNDAVELFIDTLNTRAHHRGEPTHQFVVLPFGAATEPRVGGYEARIAGNNIALTNLTLGGANGIQRAAQQTPAGWSMEMLIPFAALRHGELKPGQRISLEMQIDTGTNVFYQWACKDPRTRVSLHPNGWGEVILGGSDAKLEILDLRRQPVDTIRIGQMHYIQVADADASFFPAKDGLFNVTVRSSGGDVKQVALRPLGPLTGLAQGMLQTRPDIIRRVPMALNVVSGDTLTIEYIDAHRGNGDRYVPVRTQVKVLGPLER